jgi:hypothetical protein
MLPHYKCPSKLLPQKFSNKYKSRTNYVINPSFNNSQLMADLVFFSLYAYFLLPTLP